MVLFLLLLTCSYLFPVAGREMIKKVKWQHVFLEKVVDSVPATAKGTYPLDSWMCLQFGLALAFGAANANVV